ncbi:MAG: hypothetical protein PUE22_03530, partial [Roseburia porci]|nr:hypothetical protein [Roseburia porci]
NRPFQSDYTDKMEKSDGVNGTFRLVTEKTSRMRGQNLSLFSVEREKAKINAKEFSITELNQRKCQRIINFHDSLWQTTKE